MLPRVNLDVAARLDEVARLLELQGATPFRVQAYRRGADTVRRLERPVSDLLATGGIAALDDLPAIGPTLAGAIRDLVSLGRLPMLDRLRGESDAVAMLTSVPGIGSILAERLHRDAGIDTLEDLEAAAYDGRLARLPHFGERRVAAVRDTLRARLARVRAPDPAPEAPPSVSDLLNVDREYRAKAAAGTLPRIAPRRFNPAHLAWLPVLHTRHGDRHYTALFSNTARAHELGRTRDWVVLYADGGHGEQQFTIVTARLGPLKGKRVVRGREAECFAHYRRGPIASPGTGAGAVP
jgi:hypothetical protein